MNKTISEKECYQLLISDLKKAKAIARDVFDESVHKGAFDNLTKNQQEVLTDFAFNGCLPQFPKMMRAIADGDKKAAKKESARFFTDKTG